MGMSTYIIGLRTGSDKHRKMVAAAEALSAAGVVDLPPELKEYFTDDVDVDETGCVNDNSGLQVEIERTDAVSAHNEDMQEGYLVEVAKLPEGVTHVLFYNSY